MPQFDNIKVTETDEEITLKINKKKVVKTTDKSFVIATTGGFAVMDDPTFSMTLVITKRLDGRAYKVRNGG